MQLSTKQSRAWIVTKMVLLVRSKVALVTAGLLIISSPAFASPILDVTEVDESYTTKSISVAIGKDENKYILSAINNYSISVECIVGVTKTATSLQKKSALRKAEDICKKAKTYANSIENYFLSIKTKLINTTKSKAGNVSISVLSKDVISGYPYLKTRYKIGSSALAIGNLWNVSFRVEYPIFGGADWKTIPSAGDLVVHQYAYFCNSSLGDKSKYRNMTFNQINQQWKSECISSLNIVSGVPVHLKFEGDRYIRLIARGSNNFGGVTIMDEIVFSSKRP